MYAKIKTLSVPLVVRFKTGDKAVEVLFKRLLASFGQSKYQWIVDERAIKFQSLLLDLKLCLTSSALFKSDLNGSYHEWIKNTLPTTQIEQVGEIKVLKR